MRTALYRHFNSFGDLLYVGISLNAVSRLSAHVSTSKWAGEIANVQIEYFDDRYLALDAERTAIMYEKPKFNIVHNSEAFTSNDNDVSEIPLEKIEWDKSIRGLGVRYSLICPDCWVFEYRIGNNKRRRRSIGPTAMVSQIAAGAIARVLSERVYMGDPADERIATFATAANNDNQEFISQAA